MKIFARLIFGGSMPGGPGSERGWARLLYVEARLSIRWLDSSMASGDRSSFVTRSTEYRSSQDQFAKILTQTYIGATIGATTYNNLQGTLCTAHKNLTRYSFCQHLCRLHPLRSFLVTPLNRELTHLSIKFTQISPKSYAYENIHMYKS